jgi:hypothetical protein
MSGAYIRRLKSIEEQFEAAQRALKYVCENWRRQELRSDVVIFDLALKHYQAALGELEATYYVRMFATFEDILNDHFSERYPTNKAPKDLSAYIDTVGKRNGIGIDLRDDVHEARRQRNQYAHSGVYGTPSIIFKAARSRLNRYLDKLPDPY